MTDTNDQEAAEKEVNVVDLTSKDEALLAQDDESHHEKAIETYNSEENQFPQQKEEMLIKKKYGSLISKKPPIISMDHERAFFDSADWALAKKSKGPLEALRPKLQPTPHHQTRTRSAYSQPTTKDEADGCISDQRENQNMTLDDNIESIMTSSSDKQIHQANNY